MIGTLLAGRFRILEVAAEGGMSVIYLALDQKTSENVAVKVNKLGMEDEAEGLFEKEAQRMMELSNPHIVRTLGSGKYKDRVYIVFEFIEGDDLSTMLNGGSLRIADVVALGEYLLKGLAYAHSKGIIHKDLKPENVLFREGKPVLIDFGIAEHHDDDDQDDRIMGSVHYFSPEQAAGLKVDKRTDIYSLGIILYEAATGLKPFTGGDNVNIALMHMHQPPVPPIKVNPEIPPALNAIILKAMSKEPADRYSSAADMHRDLKRAMHSQTTPHERQKGRAKKILILLFASLAVLAGITLALVGTTTPPADTNIYMPHLIGITEEDAQKKLSDLGINYSVEYQQSADYAAGVVISQDPAATAVLEKGETVKFAVASERVAQTMPDLSGLTSQAAVKALEEMGLYVDIVEQNISGYSDNAVIDQNPALGATVFSGDRVSLTVNSHDAVRMFALEDYVGMDIEEATVALAKTGITQIVVQEVDDREEAPGEVYEQSIPEGLTDRTQILLKFAARDIEMFEGSYTPDSFDAQEGELTLQLRMKTEIGGVKVEYILWTGYFPSVDQFYLVHGEAGIIEFMLRYPGDTAVQTEVELYVNGASNQSRTVELAPAEEKS